MAKILRGEVITMGGKQVQFLGVQAGEFVLRPDSDSGVRPDDLRVEGRGIAVVIKGGKVLRVELHSEGIEYRHFQRLLSDGQKALLAELASDLAGRVWPDAGEVLQKRMETLGEDNVLQALQNLFRGVERTTKEVRVCSAIPFVGRRLAECLRPYAYN